MISRTSPAILSRTGLRPSTISLFSPSSASPPLFLSTQPSPTITPRRSVYLATPIKEALRKAKLQATQPQLLGTSKYPPTKPPSHKPGEFERSQLLRKYVSLIRSSPLLLFFQHNNLTASEWMGVRRELAAAMEAVDKKLSEESAAAANPEGNSGFTPLADFIHISVVKTSLLSQAFRLVDFYNPTSFREAALSAQGKGVRAEKAVEDEILTHYLSRHARDSVKEMGDHPLKPLLAGPIAVLAFPSLSPRYVEAAMRILAPEAPNFSAPKRRERPSLYDPQVQAGLQKFLFLGGRVWEWKQGASESTAEDGSSSTSSSSLMMTEPKVLDPWEARHIAGMSDLHTLRAQLVAMMNLPSATLASTLSAASTSLWATLESRKQVLEEEAKPAEGGKVEDGAPAASSS